MSKRTSNQPPKALTATQLFEHPEFPHVIWDLKPEKKGTVAVAKDRRGPVNIAYEVHGHGPIHLVVGWSASASAPCFITKGCAVDTSYLLRVARLSLFSDAHAPLLLCLPPSSVQWSTMTEKPIRFRPVLMSARFTLRSTLDLILRPLPILLIVREHV